MKNISELDKLINDFNKVEINLLNKESEEELNKLKEEARNSLNIIKLKEINEKLKTFKENK